MIRVIMLIGLINLSFISLSSSASGEEKTSEQKVNGFSLVQYKDNGAKKWKLDGKSAEMENGRVKIDEVSALAFGDTTSIKLKAKKGNFDREKGIVHLRDNVIIKATDGTTLKTDSLDWDTDTKNASTDELVSIKKSDFEARGTGAEVDLKDKTAELKRDVTANIASPETGGGLLEPSRSREATVITCDGPLEIDYGKNRATFRNNVQVRDKEGDIFADRIDVYLKPDTKQVRCVVARGNVRIVNGGSVTYSEKAIYLVDQGRVILPKRPRLVIKDQGKREK